jgi:DNA-binding MarR family transcriptional regulator
MKRAAAARKTAATAPEPGAEFAMPLTVSHPDLLVSGDDEAFRRTLYLMVLAFGRLQTCREAFGRVMGLTGSQFAVLIGTAYRQKTDGVSIRALADHVLLAPTHVTTEVGRLIRMGLLTKRADTRDRRGVLVKLSRRGEAALLELSPFLRNVNDLLFQNLSRKDFETVSKFLSTLALNSEYALAEIRRSERERAIAADARSAGLIAVKSKPGKAPRSVRSSVKKGS